MADPSKIRVVLSQQGNGFALTVTVNGTEFKRSTLPSNFISSERDLAIQTATEIARTLGVEPEFSKDLRLQEVAADKFRKSFII